MERIIIKTYQTRTEAEVDKGFLESRGIKSCVVADDEGGAVPYLLNATGFVKLTVSKKDYKKAYKILNTSNYEG